MAYFYFPETKGLSLEDIADVFGDNITLDDPEEEAIHRRFRDGHSRETANAQAAGEVHRHYNIPAEEKGVAAQALHIDNSPGSM
ncbi:hypothetical protein LTR47_011910 [Exophiala xenobiotica]|nr:hypothetical protein LTR92_011052 [Exophiala xenobiotica]KAK5214787.1 hypothetical protein LTR72_012091 [Exophiala xenobiotica]KAK5216918.1 hypothetical protein LTR47_011910 [Exophiala xenobiotica]KAK5241822.1 hypothetical protein LTS06_011903 [Exophiala xenobiotica]KAK5278678.1 hypothetical protein LTR40_008827 [Exophiala xenobiotica]